LASENLITNGGFETYQIGRRAYYPGEDMAGWLVGDEPPDSVSHEWSPGDWAYDGNLYVELNRLGGSISQAVSLDPGRSYTLRFFAAIGHEPDFAIHSQPSELDVVSYYPADTLQNSRIIANAMIEPGSWISPAPFGWKPSWQEYLVTFEAISTDERLLFRRDVTFPGRIVMIDSVSLVDTPVPEPSTLTLVGPAAFGLLIAAFNHRVNRRLRSFE
jgi:hypothetical protein